MFKFCNYCCTGVFIHSYCGQPIRRWYRKWKPMQGGSIEVKADLYDSLMNWVRHKVVNTAIANDLHMSADGYKILGNALPLKQ